MQCPKCSSLDTKVIDSRDYDEKTAIRRRRSCEQCNYRFNTFERYETPSFMVEKRENCLEPYNRQKVERGILRALQKRPVESEKVANLIKLLEHKWLSHGKKISSKIIGQDIMERLLELDQVAYIRFASVYKDFDDIDSFKSELARLDNTSS